MAIIIKHVHAMMGGYFGGDDTEQLWTMGADINKGSELELLNIV